MIRHLVEGTARPDPPLQPAAVEVPLMIENNPTNVVAAFEMLLEQIEA